MTKEEMEQQLNARNEATKVWIQAETQTRNYMTPEREKEIKEDAKLDYFLFSNLEMQETLAEIDRLRAVNEETLKIKQLLFDAKVHAAQECDELRIQIDALEAEKTEYKQDAEVAWNDHTLMNQELFKIKDERNRLKERVDALDEENKRLTDSLTEIREERDQFREKLDSVYHSIGQAYDCFRHKDYPLAMNCLVEALAKIRGTA